MAKSIRSKSKRKFRAIKRQNIFLPTEEARMQRVVDHSNGIEAPVVPKRFSFLVKNIPARGRQDTADMQLETPGSTIEEGTGETMAVDVVEKAPLTKIERQAMMMTRNQFKKKAKAQLKAKGRAHKLQKQFI